jgi:hypothetical protein
MHKVGEVADTIALHLIKEHDVGIGKANTARLDERSWGYSDDLEITNMLTRVWASTAGILVSRGLASEEIRRPDKHLTQEHER